MQKFIPVVLFSLFLATPAFAQSSDSSSDTHRPMSKWWVAAVAAGPLIDGATTWWAIGQSGPAMTIREGNGFYHKLFGPDPKGWQVMAFKTGQAAVLAWGVHEIGKNKEGVERVIYSVLMNCAVSGVASTLNIRRGMRARRLNAAYAVQW